MRTISKYCVAHSQMFQYAPATHFSTSITQTSACRSRKEIDAIEVDETELESQIQVHGSYRKPEFKELAIVQFWFLPYYFCKSVSWYARWFYKYNIKNEEYTEEDKEFIVRGILNISQRMSNLSPWCTCALQFYSLILCNASLCTGTWDAMEDRVRDKIWARACLHPTWMCWYRVEVNRYSLV